MQHEVQTHIMEFVTQHEYSLTKSSMHSLKKYLIQTPLEYDDFLHPHYVNHNLHNSFVVMLVNQV